MMYVIMNDEYDKENEMLVGYTHDKELAEKYVYNKLLSTGISHSIIPIIEITDPGNKPDYITIMTFYTINHKEKMITVSSTLDIGDIDDMPKEGILFDEPDPGRSLSILNKVYFRIKSDKIPKDIDLMNTTSDTVFEYIKNILKLKYSDYDITMHIPSSEFK